MSREAVGVFDSGVGGLTVLGHLTALFPREKYIYIGDNKHSPYGLKTPAQLLVYTSRILDYFVRRRVKLVVFGCNTTSATILDTLREKYPDLAMLGVVDAASDMVKSSPSQRVLIMATPATIASQSYQKRIPQGVPLACPELATMIEEGYAEKDMLAYLKKLVDKPLENCDGILLACTHYPLISPLLTRLYPVVPQYSSSLAVARAAGAYLQTGDQCFGGVEIYTTGDVAAFKRAGSRLLGQRPVERLDLT